MAIKSDFTAEEWNAMHKGVTGAGLLVSTSDRDFSDTFGESKALAHYLTEAAKTSDSMLVRELAAVHGTGFGISASQTEVETETFAALRSTIATLEEKAPDELDAYRALVIGASEAVAEAKGGVQPEEDSLLEAIGEALRHRR